jgi:hypothetical protein
MRIRVGVVGKVNQNDADIAVLDVRIGGGRRLSGLKFGINLIRHLVTPIQQYGRLRHEQSDGHGR